MRYGIRKFGGASCLVSAALGVPEKMRKDIREISKLQCDPEQQGQGHATELLRDICKEADTKRMVLMLTVEPYGNSAPLTKDQLADWYGTTFDFNPIQQEPLILARMFNPFPESGLTEKIGQIITEGI
jgi:N-acetylglutamate synthase-like GNAT family acetyltransferase